MASDGGAIGECDSYSGGLVGSYIWIKLVIRSQMLYPLSYGRNGEKVILSCRRAHITRE